MTSDTHRGNSRKTRDAFSDVVRVEGPERETTRKKDIRKVVPG